MTSRPPWRLWVCLLLGWTLVGLSFTLNYYLFASHYVAIFKQQPTLSQMLVWELPYWLLWALLTPLVFRLTRRFPLQRGHLLRDAAAHLAACLGLALAHRAVYLMAGWGLHVAVYRRLASLSEVYARNFFFNLPTGFMSYATILLVGYAIEHYRRQSALEAQLAQAQLQALKMQLQPHFLFNTLNSISTLLEEDAEAADEMLARLGDFLRLTLENPGAQEVTLQEELELLRCYLEIERVRFQDRLEVALEIAPETLDARVPNLILQPIVENAIRHGVVARTGPGRIEIRASRVDGMLRLQVRDNGPGLRPAAGPRNAPAPGSRHGLGFALTRERLERLYDGGHSFHLADAPGGGLEVHLDIPFVAMGAA